MSAVLWRRLGTGVYERDGGGWRVVWTPKGWLVEEYEDELGRRRRWHQGVNDSYSLNRSEPTADDGSYASRPSGNHRNGPQRRLQRHRGQCSVAPIAR